MNNGMKKVLALALVAAMTLSACGSTTEKPSAGTETPSTPSTPSAGTETPAAPEANEDKYQIKDLVLAKTATRELETWNVLHSQRAEDGENLIQFVDGLLETDNLGKLAPGIAESWETTDGGKTWTFKIREGVKWVDWQGNEMADCNAWDFATGLEWVLNFHKNQSANTSMPMEMIAGATEYYEWTKEQAEADALAIVADENNTSAKFFEMVGLEVVDANTLVYHCVTEKPYFDTLCPYVAMFPVDQGAIDAAGGPVAYAGVDNTGIWYNGPYTCTEFVHANTKVFTKNESYWDKDCHLFDTATYMYVDSTDTAFQLFRNGEIDYVDLSEANLNTIRNDANHEYYDNFVTIIRSKYSYQWHWNFDKHNEDGSMDDNWNKAIANKAFRQSIYYGMELTDTYKRSDPIDPMSVENNFYTMEGLVYTSDGTEYTKLVKERLGLGDYNGSTMVRHDMEKANALKAQAIEELTAIGVTFPVELDYYISGSNQVSLDAANVLKNNISKTLGDDYLVLNICTYVSSLSQEVRNPRLHSIMSNGWGADYGDPMNYLGQEIKGYDNAWYATSYSNINDVPVEDWSKDLHAAYDKFTEMVWAADAITTDLDARYNAFADAEAYMIEECLVMPYNYGTGYCLTKYNLHSTMNAMFGSCNPKMKNWETKADEPYTQTEWAEIIANKGK